MKYLIIGLGIYGSNLALDLSAQGHEVIGADNRQSNIEAIKDYISTVYLIDSTEESALEVLPLRNVDLVIVAIGENFGASVKTVALLKKMDVKHIYARAIDKLHESILEGFNIDRILTPEQHAAANLTDELSLGTEVTSMQVADDTYILKFKAPATMIGRHPDDFAGLKIIAVTRPEDSTNRLGIRHTAQKAVDITAEDAKIEDGDTVTVLGEKKTFKKIYAS